MTCHLHVGGADMEVVEDALACTNLRGGSCESKFELEQARLDFV